MSGSQLHHVRRYGVAVLVTGLVTGVTLLLHAYLSHGVRARTRNSELTSDENHTWPSSPKRGVP